MKLQKKLSQNKEGKITIWSILAIVIIVLFIWEISANYLGYSSISDYITDYDTGDNEITTFDFSFINPISHNTLTNYETWIFGIQNDVEINEGDKSLKRYLIEQYEPFPTLEFRTNAPYKLSNPYYLRVFQTSVTYSFIDNNNVGNSIVIDNSIRISAEYSLNHISDFNKDTYQVDLNNLIQDDITPSIQSNYLEIYFYDSDGSIIHYERVLLTKKYTWFR